jgi:hypothetical protein
MTPRSPPAVGLLFVKVWAAGSGPSPRRAAGGQVVKEGRMAGEKHRGAPKKQAKKPSAKTKDKQARKLATRLGTGSEPPPASEAGGGA